LINHSLTVLNALLNAARRIEKTVGLRHLVVFLISLICVGCASHASKPSLGSQPTVTGNVTSGVIEAPASERYVGEAGAHYEQPVASPDNPMPVYPPDILKKQLPPIEVDVRILVGPSGHVSSFGIPAWVNPEAIPFDASIASAVPQWKFTQLVKIIPGPGSTTLVDAFESQTSYPGTAIALPFHQDYRFIFSQSAGKANVSMDVASTVGNDAPVANPDDLAVALAVLRYELQQGSDLDKTRTCIAINDVDVGPILFDQLGDSRLKIVPMAKGCSFMKLFNSIDQVWKPLIVQYGNWVYCEHRPFCINAGKQMSAELTHDDSGWHFVRLIGGVSL
jgi:hypothetical protein